MTGALDKFFNKINFNNRDAFSECIVEKVIVHKLDKKWDIYLRNKYPLDIQILDNLKTIAELGFEDVNGVKIYIKYDNYTDKDILEYMKYYMKILSVKNPSTLSMQNNNIEVNNKNIVVEVANIVEKNIINSKKNKMIEWFSNNGIDGITVDTFLNESKRQLVQESIKDVKKSFATIDNLTSTQQAVTKEKKTNDEIKKDALFGIAFDTSKITNISEIQTEKRGVVIKGKITNVRIIESQRSEYKIFTIKVTDGTPFTLKLFTTDINIFNTLKTELLEGKTFYFRGTIQNDDYMKTLVMTIRSIMNIEENVNNNNIKVEKNVSAMQTNNIPLDDYSYFGDDYGYIPEDNYGDYMSDDAFFAFDEPIDMSINNQNNNNPTIKVDDLPVNLDVNENEKKDEIKIVNNAAYEINDNIIFGTNIKEKPTLMKNITVPVNNVTFECKIFGLDFFESSKNNIKIITLKITDETDSYVAKIFTKNQEEYDELAKNLKIGEYIKINGPVKYDEYAKDMVLTVRNIVKIPSKEIKLQDNAPVKRVELHTHTMMSQMDGVLNVSDYLDELKRMGYKAVAITDHNCAQSYPVAFHKVNDFNKGIESDEDKFKVIYGTELTMIEDSVNIVKRPVDKKSLDATYCVFDLETTGFNAGGADSIIEIGAVLLKNGEIIDRFDELINPGKPLAAKITELTSITDEMLKDKDTEENAVKRFIEFFKDYPLVAHNAKFDTSFLEMAYKKYNLGEFNNCVIDTLELSRALDSGFNRHGLSNLVKRYNVEWDEDAHHRADYDAEGTAKVFDKMIKKMDNQNIENILDFQKLVKEEDIYKFGRAYHVNILVQNKCGLKNLFKLISFANTKYLYKTPRILKSEIEKHREGLLIGSGCYESEVFKEAKSKSDEELTNIINFYDYVEVQPPEVYSHLIDTSEFLNSIELENHIKKIINATEDAGKIIVATGDVHQLRREDTISREIIVNQKVPGGGRHPLAKGDIKNIPSQHFRTTEEMLKDFEFLDVEKRNRIVIENTNKIANMCEIVEVIIDTKGVPFSPKMDNSVEIVKNTVYDKAHSIYGNPLPDIIEKRIESELSGIIKGGYDVIYLIAQKLVKHSNDEGYLVGSRGSVGSSFVATMLGITEVNPLQAHYVCPNCKHTIFEENGRSLSLDYSCGFDLPDKLCPKCNVKMDKQGQDMPFATFLGFDADKVPDIDLNFSGDNQASAHEYTKVLFGVDNVYRAGTIGTVADKTAYGFVKGYCEAKGITDMKSVEMERLAIGCTGVKRTTGQHPGGIVVIPGYMDVFDFTPYQYPADDETSVWRTTHFDYHAIEEDVLKLDILGHDDPTVLKMLKDLSGIDVTKVPLDDKETMKIFTSPEVLGCNKDDIACETGTLGIPEFGTKFVIKMLTETKPKTFAELVKISGLSHGTDVWSGNARELILSNTVEFKDVIGCRDDIMVNLINYGMESKLAFKIMEFVRKGKASKDREKWNEYAALMRESDVPEWYIGTCAKIKYMFPKAHAAAYVISAYRIAWFKVHKPLYYYAAYYSIRCNDFDISTMCSGYDAIKKRFDEINEKGFDAGNKESALVDELQIAMEMYKRGFKFKMIDLNKSHSKYFVIDDDQKSLIFPFRGLDGLGDAVATQIVEERKKAPFLSIEDVQVRAKVNSTTIEKMRTLNIFDGMSESNQLSLFD